MSFWLLLTALSPVPQAGPAPGADAGRVAEADGPRAALELLEGRALVASFAGSETLDRTVRTREVRGAARLEVEVGGRVDVAFAGRGRLVLEGPAAFEWTLAPSGDLVWSLESSARASVEVRRGGVRLELRDGWRASPDPCFLWLEDLPDGGLRLDLDAGAALELSPPSARGSAMPALRVRPGGSVRLAPAGRTPTVSGRGFEWPYGAPRAPAAAPEDARPVAWEAFVWPWWSLDAGGPLPVDRAPLARPEPRPDPGLPRRLELPEAPVPATPERRAPLRVSTALPVASDLPAAAPPSADPVGLALPFPEAPVPPIEAPARPLELPAIPVFSARGRLPGEPSVPASADAPAGPPSGLPEDPETLGAPTDTAPLRVDPWTSVEPLLEFGAASATPSLPRPGRTTDLPRPSPQPPRRRSDGWSPAPGDPDRRLVLSPWGPLWSDSVGRDPR